jgi:hypothetical protein
MQTPITNYLNQIQHFSLLAPPKQTKEKTGLSWRVVIDICYDNPE